MSYVIMSGCLLLMTIIYWVIFAIANRKAHDEIFDDYFNLYHELDRKSYQREYDTLQRIIKLEKRVQQLENDVGVIVDDDLR